MVPSACVRGPGNTKSGPVRPIHDITPPSEKACPQAGLSSST